MITEGDAEAETEAHDNEQIDEEGREASIEAEAEMETEAEVEADTEIGLEIDPVFVQEDAPLALLRLRNKAPQDGAEDPAIEQVHVISESEIKTNAKRASKQLMFAAAVAEFAEILRESCLLYTSPSPRDATLSRMPSSA